MNNSDILSVLAQTLETEIPGIEVYPYLEPCLRGYKLTLYIPIDIHDNKVLKSLKIKDRAICLEDFTSDRSVRSYLKQIGEYLDEL